MNRQNRILVSMLIVIWIAFLTWQIMVREWLGDLADKMFRLDLILVLPALIVITILVIFLIRSDIRK